MAVISAKNIIAASLTSVRELWSKRTMFALVPTPRHYWSANMKDTAARADATVLSCQRIIATPIAFTNSFRSLLCRRYSG